MSQQTLLTSVSNEYSSPLTVGITDIPTPPATYPAPAGTISPIGQNIPWWYYNNSNFANHNVQVTCPGDFPVIYLWQHGDVIYWSNNLPTAYTEGTKLSGAKVGSSFVLNISSGFAPSAT